MNIFIASADSEYFKKFAVALVISNQIHNPDKKLLITLMNPTKESIELARDLYNVTDNFMYICTYVKQDRVVYACDRFRAAENLLKNKQEVTLLDIDSYFTKPLPDIEEDLGLYIRKPFGYGFMFKSTEILNCLIHVKPSALDFIKYTNKIIKEAENKWMLDQYATSAAYNKYKDKYSIYSYTCKELDYEFKNGTLWTAKGNRKTNKTYLIGKKKLEDLYIEKSKKLSIS